MVHFNLEEKLLIAGGCATLVIFFAIILACKISPYCCLYHRCPLRAKYEEIEEEDGGKKGRSRSKPGPHRLNYASLGPIVPSVTLTSLEKFNSITLIAPKDSNLPVYTITPDSAAVPCRVQHVRSHKESGGSISGSSVHSSDGASSPAQHAVSCSSGVGSAVSSDGGGGGGGGKTKIAKRTSLNLNIEYNDKDEKFIIQPLGAQSVPTNVYGGANDSYLQILLVKDLKRRWGRKSKMAIDELLQVASTTTPSTVGDDSPEWTRTAQNAYQVAAYKTQLIRRQMNPVFNERFVVSVKEKDRQYTCMNLILETIDRFSHHSIVGTAQVGLENFNPRLAARPSEVSIQLDPYTPDLGQMLLSLCYLPTAERLHLNIIKADNLKPPPSLHVPDSLVKAMVIRRGRILEKHSTPIQFHTVNPVFNEALIFDIPRYELERVTLVLTVVHQDTSDMAESPVYDDPMCHRNGRNGSCPNASPCRRSSSANGVARKREASMEHSNGTLFQAGASLSAVQKSRSVHSVRTKPYTTLARLTFGSSDAVKGPCRQHWREMIDHPRKQIAKWHKLQP